MDTKRLLTSLIFAGAIMLIFMYFTRGGGAGAPTNAAFPLYAPECRAIPPAVPPKAIQIGDSSKASKDKLELTVNQFTAGIDRVRLNVNDYASNYKRTDPLVLLDATDPTKPPYPAKPFATIGIYFQWGNDSSKYVYMGIAKNQQGGEQNADPLWKVVRQTATDVDLQKILGDANLRPMIEVTKSFHIDPASYEVTITHTVRNLLPPHAVQKPASDKVIELGMNNVSNVVVKVAGDLKAAGKDYTVDAAAGKVSVGEGAIKPTDTLDITFNIPADTLKVKIDQLGPGELPRDDPQTDDRFYHALNLNTAKGWVEDDGFNMTHNDLGKATAGTKNETTGVMENVGTATIGGKDGQFADFSKNPQLWIAASNRFFTAAVRPLPETVTLPGGSVEAVASKPAASGPATAAATVRPAAWATYALASGHRIDQPTHVATGNIDLMLSTDSTGKPLAAGDFVSIVRLNGNLKEVPPGGSISEPLTVYFGPKERTILNGDLTAPEGSPKYDFAVYKYIKLIQFQQGCYSYCIKDFVVMPILNVLDFLRTYVAFGNYGIAIMILVIMVRACLHPLTRASQINMAKMGKQMRDVQPKLQAMKKKYADDKKKQSEEMMRIYKENNINPAGGIMGCLPMFIQMPIWAALYAGLRNDIDLRHASFIPGWINDLASPDSVFPHGIPVIGHPAFHLPLIGDIYALNLLPILLAGVFFIQMQVTTASQPAPADEQQAQMQKMSKYMIFLFPLFLYNAPSGLNLYIFASTMAGLMDTWLVRKSLKKRGILPASAPALPTHEQK